MFPNGLFQPGLFSPALFPRGPGSGPPPTVIPELTFVAGARGVGFVASSRGQSWIAGRRGTTFVPQSPR
jgi:hypothetical protein